MKQYYLLSPFFLLFFKIAICQNNKVDSLFFSEKIQEIKEFALAKDYDKAIQSSREIIERRKDAKKKAKDFYRLGFYFKKNNKRDSAYKYYLKPIQIYLTENDTINAGLKLLSLSKFESELELFNKSDSSAFSALKYLKHSKKEKKNLSIIYNCLGVNARSKKEYEEALKWYDLAILNAPDSIKKIRYLNNQANLLTDLSYYDKAIIKFNEIQKNKYYLNIPIQLKAKIIDNYAFTKFLSKQPVDESEFLEAQKLKLEIDDVNGLIANYSHLSDYYQSKNRSKALQYAYKMYELSKKRVLPKDRIEALDKIMSLEEVSKIRRFAQERNILSDSIQLAKQKSQNKFAKIIYNYEQEERQKLKAEIALAKQKSQKIFLLFTGVSLIIIFFIYLFYKNQKIKKEKVIEVYKTETRLAKKIHDVLANDVYLVMSKVQNDAKTATILHDLEKIYDLTRNISHENSPVLTGDKFEFFLRKLFEEFSKDTTRVINRGLSNTNINNLAKDKQIVVYRVLQELLVNMQKHSNASLVVITFLDLKSSIEIIYKDNGGGTSLKIFKNGLQNMDTRIKSIGGFINFESEEEKGFKANIKFKK